MIKHDNIEVEETPASTFIKPKIKRKATESFDTRVAKSVSSSVSDMSEVDQKIE